MAAETPAGRRTPEEAAAFLHEEIHAEQDKRMLSNIGILGLLITSGKVAGLPTPIHVEATADVIRLQFLELPDLQAWAAWVDEPIGEHPGKGVTHHRVQANLMGAEVRFSCVIHHRLVVA